MKQIYSIKNLTGYLLWQYIAFLAFFLLIQKPIFFFYNWTHGASQCSFSDVCSIYYNGFALDLSTAAYLSIIPFIGVAVAMCYGWKSALVRFLNGYLWIMAIVLSIVTVVDSSLYEFWEFKLDHTVFFYITDPKNAFASVSVGYIIVRLVAIVLFCLLIGWALRRPLSCFQKKTLNKGNAVLGFVVWILIGGLLFGLIRGVRTWPNTPGRAFFSKTAFLNHSALNPLFNLIYTATRSENFGKQFRFFPEEECAKIYAPLFQKKAGTTEKLLRTDRPNILYIVLEGFGAVFVENLGGMPEVGKNVSRLSQEGVNFSHCYGSSFRTDRGIVAAVSGYLAQPTTSIMRYTRKISSLPGLPKTLKKYGYETQVLYPSDMTFFNMSDYFICAGHDKLISQDQFTAEERCTKWGVPDHIAFQWLYEDIVKKHKAGVAPWYTTYLTISSHTPFDVPGHYLEDEKLNAFAYTDKSFGEFIDKLKQSPAWDNLLIVCTADHGFNHREIATAEFPHIPFFLLGGAVESPRRIETILSQTDIPATILAQLGIAHDDFIFSRDVMSTSYTYPFSFSTFNNGFNFRDSTGCTVYDNVAGKALEGADAQREKLGKAILQTLYNDLNKR